MRSLWAMAIGAMLLAACAGTQAPVTDDAGQPSPATGERTEKSREPVLRGIRPAQLPREEPGVGVGGLTHQPADAAP